jgi:hypothetical protein
MKKYIKIICIRSKLLTLFCLEIKKYDMKLNDVKLLWNRTETGVELAGGVVSNE